MDTTLVPKQNRITVHYLDTRGLAINQDLSIFGSVGGDYVINAPTLRGYQLVAASAPLSGQIPANTPGELTLTYQNLASVIVRGLDEKQTLISLTAEPNDAWMLAPVKLPTLPVGAAYYIPMGDTWEKIENPDTFVPAYPTTPTLVQAMTDEMAAATIGDSTPELAQSVSALEVVDAPIQNASATTSTVDWRRFVEEANAAAEKAADGSSKPAKIVALPTVNAPDAAPVGTAANVDDGPLQPEAATDAPAEQPATPEASAERNPQPEPAQDPFVVEDAAGTPPELNATTVLIAADADSNRATGAASGSGANANADAVIDPVGMPPTRSMVTAEDDDPVLMVTQDTDVLSVINDPVDPVAPPPSAENPVPPFQPIVEGAGIGEPESEGARTSESVAENTAASEPGGDPVAAIVANPTRDDVRSFAPTPEPVAQVEANEPQPHSGQTPSAPPEQSAAAVVLPATGGPDAGAASVSTGTAHPSVQGEPSRLQPGVVYTGMTDADHQAAAAVIQAAMQPRTPTTDSAATHPTGTAPAAMIAAFQAQVALLREQGEQQTLTPAQMTQLLHSMRTFLATIAVVVATEGGTMQ